MKSQMPMKQTKLQKKAEPVPHMGTRTAARLVGGARCGSESCVVVLGRAEHLEDGGEEVDWWRRLVPVAHIAHRVSNSATAVRTKGRGSWCVYMIDESKALMGTE